MPYEDFTSALRLGVEAARDQIQEAGGRHDHSGPGPCPLCAAKDAVVQLAAETITALAPPPALLTFRCWRCLDTKWVVVDSAPAATTVKPCATCAPDVYERWAGGHYQLHHGPCDECSGARMPR